MPVISVTRKTLIVAGAFLSAIIAVIAITAGNHAAETERKRLQEEQKARDTAEDAKQRGDETQRAKAEAERRQKDFINDQKAQEKIEAATALAKEIKEAKATLVEIQSNLSKDTASHKASNTPALINEEPAKSVPQSEEKNDGPYFFGGHRYTFFEKPSITYAQSVEVCHAKGGILVIPNTREEWQWIVKTFLDGDPDKKFRTIYLGIEMPAKRWWDNSETKWVDGSTFNVKEACWAENHPWGHTDAYGYRFRWIINFGGSWAAVGPNDDRINGYICEWD